MARALAFLTRIGDFVRGLTGWQRFVLALAMGAISALAYAPFGIFPALLLCFAGLVLLIDGTQTRPRPIWNAAFVGWTFAFGQFLLGFYWVGYAFMVDAADHAWQIPIIEFCLPGGMALYIAAACALAARFWRPDASRVFALAICYALGEWVRGHALTGFPWNLPAYGWGASLGVMQSVALFGSYGLTLLTVLFGASLALLFTRAGDWRVPAGMSALFVVLWIGGDVRLALHPTVPIENIHLRLVQPNVPQTEKYVPRYRERNWRRLIDLSLAKNGPTPTHIVWPEAAPPFLLTRAPEALDDIALMTSDKVLLTGAVRIEASSATDYRLFNSLYIFAHGGQLLATYDKFHLVPFGEYLPLKSLFNAIGIAKLVNSPGDFRAGRGPMTFDIPGAPPVTPLICYEILFPDEIAAARRPGWYVNVTDDSWFGPPSSTGPYQHLLTARFRAIEQGLPIARDANTGISAVIDPVGRITVSLAAGQMGAIDAMLPAALPRTPYSRFGEWLFVVLLVLCAAAGWIVRREIRA
ncbi:MAG TPA: apolipoprotein N-acyltransferase [Rhizomicrobium sp.]|jgi:apolipoprotein N-acyltransferase